MGIPGSIDMISEELSEFLESKKEFSNDDFNQSTESFTTWF